MDSLPYVEATTTTTTTESEHLVNQLIEEELQTFHPPNYLHKYAQDTATFEVLLHLPLVRDSPSSSIGPPSTAART